MVSSLTSAHRFGFFILAGVGLAVILTGCTPAPAPAPASPDTRDADIKAIKDVEATWVQNFATKDADKIATVYAEDASVFITDMSVINGMAAIKGGRIDISRMCQRKDC